MENHLPLFTIFKEKWFSFVYSIIRKVKEKEGNGNGKEKNGSEEKKRSKEYKGKCGIPPSRKEYCFQPLESYFYLRENYFSPLNYQSKENYFLGNVIYRKRSWNVLVLGSLLLRISIVTYSIGVKCKIIR